MSDETQVHMPTYLGMIIVKAHPMDELDFLEMKKSGAHFTLNRESRAGYRIFHPGGDMSWLPKKVFETTHRQVTGRELIFLQNAPLNAAG